MENSKISWTDHTFNPWWGCTEVSPGCDNCYAREFAKRYGQSLWGANVPRRLASDSVWRKPLSWNRAAEGDGVRQRVFCASMSDVFDREVPREWRERLWELIRQTPGLDWLILTKRPNLIERYLPDDWHAGYPNVWLGTSIEHRGYLWRAHTLAEVPAAVHFLSCEPLIGPIPSLPLIGYDPDYPEEGSWPLFDWLIVGAESGPHRRPFDNAWALDIQRQCRQADVAFFAKQGPGLHSEAPFGVPELDAPSARAWPR